MFGFQKIATCVAAAAVAAFSAVPADIADTNSADSEVLIVELRGSDVGETRIIDGVPMNCFDAQLVDVETGQVIGVGTDCLDMSTIAGDPNGAFAISNTSIFHLPQGTLKTKNRTTVTPVVEGSPGLTHLTGDVAVTENILAATGAYRGMIGMARLHGGVDMSRMAAENIIDFNCVFVITLMR